MLILCLDIEFGWLLIPCYSPKSVEVINKIVLAISYSYISAMLFYVVVSEIPFRRRKKYIAPLLQCLLCKIKDHLRNCIEVVFPLVIDKANNRENFCKEFSTKNLHESFFLNKNVSRLSVLKENRSKIMDYLNTLLAYREYLDDDVFQNLNEVLNSEFIKNGIIPPPDVEDLSSVSYESNQEKVGECIYDLYEKFCGMLKNE